MHELPSTGPWLEPSVRQDFSSLEAVKHEKATRIRFSQGRGGRVLRSDIRPPLRAGSLGRGEGERDTAADDGYSRTRLGLSRRPKRPAGGGGGGRGGSPAPELGNFHPWRPPQG